MQQYVIFNALKEYCIPKEEEDNTFAHILYMRNNYIFEIKYIYCINT